MVQVSSPSPRRSGAARPPRRAAFGIAATATAAALAALASVPVAASAPAAGPAARPAGPAAPPLAPPPVGDEDRAGDHLTVTVRHAGARWDGRYEVYCHPEGGTHPDVHGACGALDRNTRWGHDTFAPVPTDSICTFQYGGPATAQVTGRWAGRPVDAAFDRRDGCRIDRWNRLVPFLPDVLPDLRS
ncbi:SSI family serine proteinase inhibitor [Streptomyces tropicalis]|uniref:SSI family serine proteinase inhibitor n=1 Tax=Streptomyces tropicalis TaxID=3034234 RepID=A0ABT6AEN0_9ACTN|nr:SSI family serine proteinase inhibitor [Streptomyces tropicalis]MDF3302928.1 SSI family serine proteinase inhibitor [Streptomyces tropicalis]